MQIPDSFYRISAKAIIYNEEGDKFLVAKEDNDFWAIPGGGLDFEETPHDCIAREIKEEMGLEVIDVARDPAYFLTYKSTFRDYYMANIVYETKVSHYNFTPSLECLEIQFVNIDSLEGLQIFPEVRMLAELIA